MSNLRIPASSSFWQRLRHAGIFSPSRELGIGVTTRNPVRGRSCNRAEAETRSFVHAHARACLYERRVQSSRLESPRSPFSRVKLITGAAIIYFHFPRGESLPALVPVYLRPHVVRRRLSPPCNPRQRALAYATTTTTLRRAARIVHRGPGLLAC